ncbi:DUF2267 domain-containing protein [Streptomyces sp. SID1328]|uniref:DUF2267 domain-containing protein n=1 Tax=Streptomyces sp. SID1328 TaxID=2690250 RepID=UPI00136DE124|nr:DUF2267 domain-containing protein [Streptomyces sp. SID1328]MYV41756.1 DUF2267 domain-containing protein [Streptomyces sp. SID1328]
MTVTTMQPRSPMTTSDWTNLVEAVRETGRYPTTAEAEQVTRIVLSGFGGVLTGDSRAAFAEALPPEACEALSSTTPESIQPTAREFVESMATRIEGATPATARWHASSVLNVLAERAGTPTTARLISQLPPGYALLFGLAELMGTAA